MKFNFEKPKLDNYTINIIVWNLVPYWGVLFLKWQPITVFACYAFESIIIGIFNVFKLIVVYFSGNKEMDDADPNSLGFFTIPAFVFSYGLLAICQFFIFFSFCDMIILGDKYVTPFNQQDTIDLLTGSQSIFLILSIYLISYAYLFINDFILTGDYTRRTMRDQLTEPFPFVMGSQFIVLLGAFLYGAFGNGIMILPALTIIKVITQLLLKNHKPSEIFA